MIPQVVIPTIGYYPNLHSPRTRGLQEKNMDNTSTISNLHSPRTRGLQGQTWFLGETKFKPALPAHARVARPWNAPRPATSTLSATLPAMPWRGLPFLTAVLSRQSRRIALA